MKNIITKRLLIIGCCAAMTLMTLTGLATAQDDKSGNPKVNSRSVVWMSTGMAVPTSGSSLSRSRGGIFFTLTTSGLTPGDAVTLWLAVFNNPEFCATNPCTPADFANPAVDGTLLNTGGRVIGPDGSATFGAYRAVGDVTGARPGVGTLNGLVDPLRAQIHLVIRDHGVAQLGNPSVLQEQLTMFFGGCPAGVGCANLQASVNDR
jgi:hypothetical protein